jgi:hypothetical protein
MRAGSTWRRHVAHVGPNLQETDEASTMNFLSPAGRRAALALLAFNLLPAQVWAQAAATFPNRPIHIVVPFTAGGKPEELASAVRTDAAIFDETIKRSNIKIDPN